VRFFNKFQAQSRGGVLSIIADYIHQNTVYGLGQSLKKIESIRPHRRMVVHSGNFAGLDFKDVTTSTVSM
jgi:hypothetical protein